MLPLQLHLLLPHALSLPLLLAHPLVLALLRLDHGCDLLVLGPLKLLSHLLLFVAYQCELLFLCFLLLSLGFQLQFLLLL